VAIAHSILIVIRVSRLAFYAILSSHLSSTIGSTAQKNPL